MTATYIKEGSSYQATRRIFYNVSFDDFERQQIKNFEGKLLERKILLPTEWTDNEVLKHLYAANFDYDKAIEHLRLWKEWRSDPISKTLSEGVLELFKSGALYTYGRDKQLRPIVILECGKIDFSRITRNDINAALTILMDTVIRYCYYPGKIENCVILIDTRKLSIQELPTLALCNWIEIGNACFPSSVHKIYIIEPPAILKSSWRTIEAVMDKSTVAKIEFIAPNGLLSLRGVISSAQLEDKFGGLLSNLRHYWPPNSTDENLIGSMRGSRKSLNESHSSQKNQYGMAGQGGNKLENSASRGHFDMDQTGSFFHGSGELYPSGRNTAAPRTEPVSFVDSQFVSGRASQVTQGRTNARKVDPKDEDMVRNMIYSRVEKTPPKNRNDGRYSQSNRPTLERVNYPKDENIVRNMIYSKVQMTPPKNDGRFSQHNSNIVGGLSQREEEAEIVGEKVEKSTSHNIFTSIKDNVLNSLSEKRDEEKRMDDFINQKLPAPGPPSNKRLNSSAIPSHQSGKSSRLLDSRNNVELFESIANDNRLLRELPQAIPIQKSSILSNDFEEVPNENKEKIAGRSTVDAKLKSHVDKRNSPEKWHTRNTNPQPEMRVTSPSYQPQREKSNYRSPEKLEGRPVDLSSQQYKPVQAQEQKKNSIQSNSQVGSLFEMPPHLDASYKSAYNYTKRNEVEEYYHRQIEDWYQAGKEEEAEEQEPETYEEGTGFCGLCISKKFKKPKKTESK